MCGTPVPPGSMVAVLPYLIHRNPGRLAEPADFDPARFLSPAPGHRGADEYGVPVDHRATVTIALTDPAGATATIGMTET